MSISNIKQAPRKGGRTAKYGKQKAFGQFLKERRERHGLDQKQCAAALGFDLTQLSKYETGKSLPHLPRLKRMAQFYEVDIMTLIDLVVAEDEDE